MPAAFAAACLLLLQSMLGASAFGTGPNASQLDAFGNVICTHEGAAQLPSGDPHQHLPTCCVLGCGMLSPAYVPPGAGTLLGSLSSEAVAFVLPAFRHPDFARNRSPSNPRAPPAAA
ncbi:MULTISPECIES: hypothetical protein [unclassified Mesorhizobium]|uniref:hypothetical protein n=1 Tax=unclassified Mesorhizobium TaxID=325217 RepID=UPI000FDA36CD|nr:MULTISPECIES: hypothetical protein [unclassified Mesorhizobium]TGQ45997.1 hypothetical protein EN859_006620 [Mesorhizobium sp. M00.F.Ca.ET.216.01.1.1]TIS59450.1 MAG: hypothetical protein E5W91_05475 [Mesorhizobium sp.]TJW05551.1 MAG: hypothetical protein E5W82_28605 [Mesorhizobium sp.]TJW45586.1 MAG: hypothetical protein E5W83_11110 [Mesorhizobium sp.]